MKTKDAAAVVTGGASGLGLATTKRLLDAGGLGGRRGHATQRGWRARRSRVLRKPTSPTKAAVEQRAPEPADSLGRVQSSSATPAPATRFALSRDGVMAARCKIVDINLVGTFNVMLRLGAEEWMRPNRLVTSS